MLRHLVLIGLIAPALSVAEVNCRNELIVIDARFDGGRLDHCRFTSDHAVELTFRAEDFRVWDQFSWFAFRVASAESQDLTIRLQFPDSYARFWPKLSRDRHDWLPADPTSIVRSEVGRSMTLQLTADETGTWVAAQELLTGNWYRDWLLQLESHYDVRTSDIGTSLQGRPVPMATTADRPEAVLLIGRQHPGEVPGAIAMRRFVDRVLGTTDLAREFRRRYMLIVLPLVNPDGVALGHARHNDGMTDLNRDWGPFSQPETRGIAGLLDELDARGVKLRLMLDFHATKLTDTMIFYTQTPDDQTDPKDFAARWLGRVEERIDGLDFDYAPREPSGLGNTKNYFFERYGIPAITYEVADELDRELIDAHTPVFADEMMRTLLEAD